MASGLAITSSNRIDERFALLREQGRKALVCYATAGHPDRARSIALLRGLEDAGADVVEVGVPFSDPLADGPVIQASSQIALDAGTTFSDVLEIVGEAALDVPVVLFGYLNPFLAAGSDALDRMRTAGCDGVLITDLPVGADPPLEARFTASPLAFVRLVAPTTPVERMRLIAQNGSGFVYLISRLGVTGMQQQVAPELGATVARLRSVTTLPICVGFGVTDARQAATVAAVADGVVVGSAIVRAAGTSVDAAIALTRSLRAGIDNAG
jgi:tryptophan synthase alpha chain